MHRCATRSLATSHRPLPSPLPATPFTTAPKVRAAPYYAYPDRLIRRPCGLHTRRQQQYQLTTSISNRVLAADTDDTARAGGACAARAGSDLSNSTCTDILMVGAGSTSSSNNNEVSVVARRCMIRI